MGKNSGLGLGVVVAPPPLSLAPRPLSQSGGLGRGRGICTCVERSGGRHLFASLLSTEVEDDEAPDDDGDEEGA